MVFVARENSGETIVGTGLSSCPLTEDLPPELCSYRDEGCELAPSCLECPYPECLMEMEGPRRSRKYSRDGGIRILAAHGWKQRDLATLFGVSTRTVQRVLRQHDAEPR